MRSSKSRSRNNKNRNPRPTGGSLINRVFDSSGPDGKVRGTPQQIIEKYNQLHRDAQLSNDRVAAENFAQHAEHYTRMLAEAMREVDRAREEQEQFNRDRQSERDRDRQPRARVPDGAARDPGFQDQPDVAVLDNPLYADPIDPRDMGLVETPEEQPRPGYEARPRQDNRSDNRGDRQSNGGGDRQSNNGNDRQNNNGDRRDRNQDRRDRPDQRADQRSEPRADQRPEPRTDQRLEPRADQRPEPRTDQRPEPRQDQRREQPERRERAPEPVAAGVDTLPAFLTTTTFAADPAPVATVPEAEVKPKVRRPRKPREVSEGPAEAAE